MAENKVSILEDLNEFELSDDSDESIFE